jgi:hypothetical protein
MYVCQFHHDWHQNCLAATVHICYVHYHENRPRVNKQSIADINYSIYRVVLHVCIILLSLAKLTCIKVVSGSRIKPVRAYSITYSLFGGLIGL